MKYGYYFEICFKKKVVSIFAHLSNQSKMYEEAGHTDDENKDLLSHVCTKELWKQIAHCGDNALHIDKLVTKIK